MLIFLTSFKFVRKPQSKLIILLFPMLKLESEQVGVEVLPKWNLFHPVRNLSVIHWSLTPEYFTIKTQADILHTITHITSLIVLCWVFASLKGFCTSYWVDIILNGCFLLLLVCFYRLITLYLGHLHNFWSKSLSWFGEYLLLENDGTFY